MRSRWSEAGLADLYRIKDYIGQRDVAAAVEVIEAITRGIARLEAFPYSGVRTGNSDVWKISIPRVRYLVFYSVLTEVVILRVRHAAENWRP